MNNNQSIKEKYLKAVEFKLETQKFTNSNQVISNQTLVIFIVTSTYFLISHLPSKSVKIEYWNMLILFYIGLTISSMLFAEILHMIFRKEKVKRFHLFSKNMLEKNQMKLLRTLDLISSIILIVLMLYSHSIVNQFRQFQESIMICYFVILLYVIIKLTESIFSITYGNKIAKEEPDDEYVRAFKYIEEIPKATVVIFTSIIMLFLIYYLFYSATIFKYNTTLIYATYIFALQYAINHFALNFSNNIVMKSLEAFYLELLLDKHSDIKIEKIYNKDLIHNSVLEINAISTPET